MTLNLPGRKLWNEALKKERIFFLGSWITIQLGIMNLIVAVIVDKATEARENDAEFKMREKQHLEDQRMAEMKRMFEEMDKDENGEMSLQELQRGARTNDEFGNILSLMDISSDQLETVFKIIDQDGSGSVSQEEFCEQLVKMKSQDSRTLLMLIKHQLVLMEEKIDQLEGARKPSKGIFSIATKIGAEQASPDIDAPLATNVAFQTPHDAGGFQTRLSEIQSCWHEGIVKIQEAAMEELNSLMVNVLSGPQGSQPREKAIADMRNSYKIDFRRSGFYGEEKMRMSSSTPNSAGNVAHDSTIRHANLHGELPGCIGLRDEGGDTKLLPSKAVPDGGCAGEFQNVFTTRET